MLTSAASSRAHVVRRSRHAAPPEQPFHPFEVAAGAPQVHLAPHRPTGSPQLRTLPAARARTQLSGSTAGRTAEQRSASPGSSALGTSIEYRVKKDSKPNAPPLLEFMDKLRLAWNIFFPERPPELSAKEQGKQRLRMILVADRCGLSPVGLTEMKKNILRSIEPYVDIESEEQIEVSITLEPEVGTVYSVAVPIRRVKPEARMAWEADGSVDELTFEYDPDDFESDPSARFPYGT